MTHKEYENQILYILIDTQRLPGLLSRPVNAGWLFRIKMVYIRFIGTHKEYDQIKDIENI